MLDRPPAQPATLDDVLAEVRELRALFEAHVGVADDSDEMSVLAVAVLVRKSTVTVRAWCGPPGPFAPEGQLGPVRRAELVAVVAAGRLITSVAAFTLTNS